MPLLPAWGALGRLLAVRHITKQGTYRVYGANKRESNAKWIGKGFIVVSMVGARWVCYEAQMLSKILIASSYNILPDDSSGVPWLSLTFVFRDKGLGFGI